EDDHDDDAVSDTLAGQETGGLSAETVREEVAREEAVGEEATTALSADEAEAERERVEGRRAAVRVRPPSSGRDDRARRPGWRTRSRGRIGAALALLALAAAVVGLYAGSRQFYFLGTDDRGVVALYRGLPY